MEQRCRERKNEILMSHEPEPFSGDLVRDIEKIVERAKQSLSRKNRIRKNNI